MTWVNFDVAQSKWGPTIEGGMSIQTLFVNPIILNEGKKMDQLLLFITGGMSAFV